MTPDMSNALLWPVLAMAALTFAVATCMGIMRWAAIGRREVKVGYFRLNQGEAPERLMQIGNHYRNLFEAPVLFYTLVVFILIVHRADTAYVVLAWLFVGTRIVHTLIHTTVNIVLYRFYAFLCGVFLLMIMWGRFAFQLFAA